MSEPTEQQATGEESTETSASAFHQRMQESVGGNRRVGEEMKEAVQVLAERALSDTAVVSDDTYAFINGCIAEIDKKLTDQVNAILHHEKFQKIESAWRGLHYLVGNTETDTSLKIKVLNISKDELAKTLSRSTAANWDRNPIFRKVYEGEFDQWGGEPFGCIVGDYHFDHSPADVKTLGQMAKIGSAAHCPFIAGAGSSLMELESWQELPEKADLKAVFELPTHAAWRSLRDSEDAKYLGLAMPRFLARLPYGKDTEKVEEFDFEEAVDGTEHEKYCWANSAYAMATNITRSHKLFGWCTSIRGVENGGAVEGLPVHTFPSDDGGVDMKCPTEVAIGQRRENELSDCGLLGLIHQKNTDIAAFISGQSLLKPKEYNRAEATENAKLGARLPFLFATSRFAHYLKAMLYPKIASNMEQADLEKYLSDWIKDFVLSNPQDHGPEMRAKKPLAEAAVVVSEIEGSPGAYQAHFQLRPHYQLESVDISLSLVSRVDRQQ